MFRSIQKWSCVSIISLLLHKIYTDFDDSLKQSKMTIQMWRETIYKCIHVGSPTCMHMCMHPCMLGNFRNPHMVSQMKTIFKWLVCNQYLSGWVYQWVQVTHWLHVKDHPCQTSTTIISWVNSQVFKKTIGVVWRGTSNYRAHLIHVVVEEISPLTEVGALDEIGGCVWCWACLYLPGAVCE